jgi:hypothetical protein
MKKEPNLILHEGKKEKNDRKREDILATYMSLKHLELGTSFRGSLRIWNFKDLENLKPMLLKSRVDWSKHTIL